MFELVIKQINGDYPENHIYHSDKLFEVFEMVRLSIKLSKKENSFIIREIEEGQIDED